MSEFLCERSYGNIVIDWMPLYIIQEPIKMYIAM